MTFGGGRHLCLGMHMARAELQEGLGCLVRRLARIEIDGPVTWAAPLGFQGPRSLPVRFAARG
jgi:cytochrome P450